VGGSRCPTQTRPPYVSGAPIPLPPRRLLGYQHADRHSNASEPAVLNPGGCISHLRSNPQTAPGLPTCSGNDLPSMLCECAPGSRDRPVCWPHGAGSHKLSDVGTSRNVRLGWGLVPRPSLTMQLESQCCGWFATLCCDHAKAKLLTGLC
jgi:hypothetical protein